MYQQLRSIPDATTSYATSVAVSQAVITDGPTTDTIGGTAASGACTVAVKPERGANADVAPTTAVSNTVIYPNELNSQLVS